MLSNLRMSQALRLTSGVALLIVFLFGILGSDVSFIWKLFILFMSLNQIQSSFTNWCPIVNLYKNLGVKEDCE